MVINVLWPQAQVHLIAMVYAFYACLDDGEADDVPIL